jgi:hypothetical protein
MKEAGYSSTRVPAPIIDVNGMIFARPNFDAIVREYRK